MSPAPVSFFVIGAQKSGTTSLARQLDAHPDIAVAASKEPMYFNEVEDWRPGLGRYHHEWDQARPDQVWGECSTTYTFLPEFLGTHDRVHAYNPDARLVYVMRHPVERMVSNYAHRIARGITKVPIDDDLRRDPTYVNRSRYAVQLRPWRDVFAPEQLLLLTMEEHLADPEASLARIGRHIGVDPDRFPAPDTKVRHASTGASHLNPAGSKLKEHPAVRAVLPLVPDRVRTRLGSQFRITIDEKPQLSAPVRRALWELVADDVAEVERWMGRPLREWQQPTRANR